MWCSSEALHKFANVDNKNLVSKKSFISESITLSKITLNMILQMGTIVSIHQDTLVHKCCALSAKCISGRANMYFQIPPLFGLPLKDGRWCDHQLAVAGGQMFINPTHHLPHSDRDLLATVQSLCCVQNTGGGEGGRVTSIHSQR